MSSGEYQDFDSPTGISIHLPSVPESELARLRREISERDAALARCVESIKTAMSFIRLHHWNDNAPGRGVWDLDAAGSAYDSLKGATSIPTSAQATAKVQQWQPIETAPKEMNKHFLLFGDGPRIEDCAYVGYLTYLWGPLEWLETTGRYVMKPTYWMPLPEPPTEAIREEKEGE